MTPSDTYTSISGSTQTVRGKVSIPTLPLGPPPPIPPPPPPSLPKHQPTPVDIPSLHSVDHTMANLVSGLSSDLRVFLEPDHEKKYEKIQKLSIYRILLHFNPRTTSRYTHTKKVLYAAFKSELLPRLKPFQLPPAPTSMEVDDSAASKDFNPLGRKTTRKMLHDAILQKNKNAEIPSTARLDGLRILYQAHVDPHLVIPGQSKTIRMPRIISDQEVDETDMEDLRLALQSHAPQIFVHTIPMTHRVLRNLYLQFILDEDVPSPILVRGFHYSIIE